MHLSIFLVALSPVKGRASSNTSFCLAETAEEMLTGWVGQKGHDSIGKTPGRV